MKKRIYLIANILACIVFLYAHDIQAQVTIGAGEVPDKDALLDLKENDLGSSTKGLLLPRVSLLSTASPAPMSAHVAGMTVYNTAVGGDVTPGFYYNDGLSWLRLAINSTTSTEWLLDGNTNGETKTIGTKDAYDLPIIVNSAEVMRAIWDVSNSVARVAIGTPVPAVVASVSSSSTTSMQLAKLTAEGGDASFNGITIGKGAAQIVTNTALGHRSLYNNQTGGYNHASGYETLFSNTSGANNLAVGNSAVYSNTVGSGNTGVGSEALYNSAGNNNIALGFQAGKFLSSGSNNIAIGYNQQLASSSNSNQLNIGGVIFGTGLTGSATTPAGNIGIGTTAPNNSAILELNALNKGFLPPRVALASSTDVITIASPATGLLVYNTGAGALSTAGYFYWDGSSWAHISAGVVGGIGTTRNITIVTGNRTTANPYVVQASDYYVFIRVTGTVSSSVSAGTSAPYLNTNYNIELPDPALNTGREIFLINDSYGASSGSAAYNVFTNYPMFGKALNTTGNYTSPVKTVDYTSSYCIASGYSRVKIVSDGVRWISVNIDVV